MEVPPVLPETIRTERLTLRRPHPADLDGFVEIQTDAEVRRFLGGPRSEAEVREAAKERGLEALGAPGHYVVATNAGDAMIGLVSLIPRPVDQPGHVTEEGGELELSYVFRRASWGNGYATEAARALLASAAGVLAEQPVIIITQSANTASLRLAARLEFQQRDTFQQFGAEQTLAVRELTTR